MALASVVVAIQRADEHRLALPAGAAGTAGFAAAGCVAGRVMTAARFPAGACTDGRPNAGAGAAGVAAERGWAAGRLYGVAL